VLICYSKEVGYQQTSLCKDILAGKQTWYCKAESLRTHARLVVEQYIYRFTWYKTMSITVRTPKNFSGNLKRPCCCARVCFSSQLRKIRCWRRKWWAAVNRCVHMYQPWRFTCSRLPPQTFSKEGLPLNFAALAVVTATRSKLCSIE